MEVKLVKFRYISTVFIAIFLSACSASGIKYSEIVQTELNGQSEIIVFRKSQLAASGGCYRINVDGKEIKLTDLDDTQRYWAHQISDLLSEQNKL